MEVLKSAVFPYSEEIFKRFVKLVINRWFSREKKLKKKWREKSLNIKVGKLHNETNKSPWTKMKDIQKIEIESTESIEYFFLVA